MRLARAADLQAGIAYHVRHQEQWMRSRDTLLPLARQKVDLETASYSAGRAGLLDVIQAQTMLANSEIETLDREALVARDGARLVLTYGRSEEHTSELQSLMRISYAVFCLKKKNTRHQQE